MSEIAITPPPTIFPSTISPPITAAGRNDLLISGLGKRYRNTQAAGGELQVLQGIDLHVPAGRFVSIVGASGCGKSTLLRLVLGLDAQYEGRIELDGRPIAGTGLERGIVFQDHRLFPWLTVEQNIAVGLRNAPLQRIWQAERITMLLVTHDVDEAVFRGDQVIVMQPHPGRIRRIVDVDLPRPRRRSDPRFVALREDVLDDFSDVALNAA